MSGFEVLKQGEVDNLMSLGDQQLNLLNDIIIKMSHLPTAADYLSLQSNKSDPGDVLNTLDSTRGEHKKVQHFLKKVINYWEKNL